MTRAQTLSGALFHARNVRGVMARPQADHALVNDARAGHRPPGFDRSRTGYGTIWLRIDHDLVGKVLAERLRRANNFRRNT